MNIENRKAFHDFHILEKYEAGLMLEGCEVKSMRAGKANMRDAFAQHRGNELWLVNMHIDPYFQGAHNNPDPTRARKLLLNKNELAKLIGRVREKGLTIVPLRAYLKKNIFKVEIALVKAKKLYDKRDSIKKKEVNREMQRALRSRNRD